MKPQIWFEQAILAGCLMFQSWLVFQLLLVANVGFDITDESYYLLHALSPDDNAFLWNWFGIYTGLFWDATADGIAGFRRAGMVALAVSTLLLSLALICWCEEAFPKKTLRRSYLAFFVCGLAGTILYYRYFLLTPSYNWLALIGMNLALTGLFAGLARRYYWGTVTFIAVGGFLTFAGKPTSGILLLLVLTGAAFSITSWGKTCRLMLPAAVAAAFLAGLHLYFVDGGFQVGIAKLLTGAEILSSLESGHSISISFFKIFTFIIKVPYSGFIEFPVSAVVLISLVVSSILRSTFLHRVPSFSLVCFAVVLILEILLKDKLVGPFNTLAVYWGSFGSFVLVASGRFQTKLKESPAYAFPLLVLFTLLPLVHFFGSNGGVGRGTTSSIGFAFIGVVLFTAISSAKKGAKSPVPYICVALVVWSFSSLNYGMQKPYRMPHQVHTMKTSHQFPNDLGSLLVSKELAQYAEMLTSDAALAGFKAGTPIVDLTGGSPGVILLLEGRFVGTPWIFGRYPGSEVFARATLEATMQCDLENAWILTAPNGIRAINSSLLSEFGLEFPAEYTKVSKLQTDHRSETQHLWKPQSTSC